MEERLCINGHLWIDDAMHVMYGDPDEINLCPVCNTPAVWEHSIDQTNGCDTMDHTHPDSCCCGMVNLRVREAAVICICKECNCSHIAKEATYDIPTTFGRYRRDSYYDYSMDK